MVRKGSSSIARSLVKIEETRMGVGAGSDSVSICFSSTMVSNSLRRFSISSRSSRWVRRRRFWSLARRWRVKKGSLPDRMRRGGGGRGSLVSREFRKSCVLWEIVAFGLKDVDGVLDV